MQSDILIKLELNDPSVQDFKWIYGMTSFNQLIKILKNNTHLQTLDLIQYPIRSEEILILFEALKFNTTLRSFKMLSDNIEILESNIFAEMIQQNTTLESIRLYEDVVNSGSCGLETRSGRPVADLQHDNRIKDESNPYEIWDSDYPDTKSNKILVDGLFLNGSVIDFISFDRAWNVEGLNLLEKILQRNKHNQKMKTLSLFSEFYNFLYV
jgi:hypothetical protein